MHWKLFTTTFVSILVAEMGDKTQLATFGLASGGGSRWVVFFAASLALIAATAIAVLGGAVVTKYVPEIWLKRGAGVVFIVLGILYLLAKPEPPAAPDNTTPNIPAERAS